MDRIITPEIQQTADRVFEVMGNRVSAEEVNRIKKAFDFAEQAHRGQTRKSGAPYIIHPTAVALIAAEELELDANTVIAAFLHDVVEDTPHTVEEIRSIFGDDVAFLVDVVTKRKKKKFEHTKQVDNYKQILDSVHYDVRALLVKLSDRLHNMRTLDSMRPDKQMKIAGETDFFYAPLAGRLGLYHVKSELENLSFRFRCPREFEAIENQLEDYRAKTEGNLKEFMSEIDQILKEGGIKARTAVRYRRPYSIWRVMNSEGCDFAHVDFKRFVRIIYEPTISWSSKSNSEKDTALSIYSLIASNFKERPGSVSNFIDNPKDNGYQSFHVKVLNNSGSWDELHIASERMHVNAKLGCVVERDKNWLERFKTVLQNLAESSNGFLFMEGVSSSLYNEDIIAFTPKGKGVILPKGATALDFAFEVHSEVGEHAQYARINGKLCPIKSELHRGDCVEIGTSDHVHPVPEWLDIVKTYKAKHHIHDLLRNEYSTPYNICPHCRPLPGDEIIGFQENNGTVTIHSRHCSHVIKLASENGDAIVDIPFESSPRKTYPVKLRIIAIDRYHLLRDIIDCFVEKQHLSLGTITSVTEDEIVTCTIDVPVHSADELTATIRSLSEIKGVEEVQKVD